MSKESKISRGIIIVGICVVAVLVSGVAVACSWNTNNKKEATQVAKQEETPAQAAVQDLTNEANGNWNEAYNKLLPQQQAVISREIYLRCSKNNTVPNAKFTVVATMNEQDIAPGVGNINSVAVSLNVTVNGDTIPTVVHQYNVNGSWRSSVDQKTFDAESKGQCK